MIFRPCNLDQFCLCKKNIWKNPCKTLAPLFCRYGMGFATWQLLTWQST